MTTTATFLPTPPPRATVVKLSFADGHAEAWKWREATTLSADRIKGWVQGVAGVPGRDRDLQRIHQTVPLTP